MKYLLILLVFVSCSSDKETASPIALNVIDSSLYLIMDSTVMNIDSLTPKIELAKSNIRRLEMEKESLLSQLGNEEKTSSKVYVYRDTIQDNHGKIIADLRNRLNQKESEIASLKRQLDYKPQIDKVAVAIEVEKPSENSLIVQPVPSNNIDVYLIPYSKKAKKSLMVYEASCDLSLINKFEGKLASTYKGQHFFNDAPPGKYIIKFCTYFGNYLEFERTNEKQIIALATSPPIK